MTTTTTHTTMTMMGVSRPVKEVLSLNIFFLITQYMWDTPHIVVDVCVVVDVVVPMVYHEAWDSAIEPPH